MSETTGNTALAGRNNALVMHDEKKDLAQLRRMIIALQNKATKMHESGTDFVISDRLNDKLGNQPLASWLIDEFGTILLDIDQRTVELMDA